MSKFKLTKGIQQKPDFIVLYGVEGIGKTTFACNAPSPLVLDVEGGSSQINVDRIEPESLATLDAVIEAINHFASNDQFKTLIIDSLSKLEELAWAKTCQRKSVKGKTYKSIEDFGYKQGYIFVLDEWMEFINACVAARAKGKNIICLGHNITKNFDDPTLIEKYARYELDLHPKAGALIRKYVDAVLFANYKTLVKDGKGLETGERSIFTERRPGHDAKNRFCLPYELPLSWEEYTNAKAKTTEDPAVYKRQIEAMAQEVKDEPTRTKVLSAIKGDLSIPQLKNYISRLETIINE